VTVAVPTVFCAYVFGVMLVTEINPGGGGGGGDGLGGGDGATEGCGDVPGAGEVVFHLHLPIRKK
jgi:hypothetical protein